MITFIENFFAVFHTPYYAGLKLKAYEAEGIGAHPQVSAEATQTLASRTSGSVTRRL